MPSESTTKNAHQPMSEAITEAEVAALRAEHVLSENRTGHPVCRTCYDYWPCRVSRLLAERQAPRPPSSEEIEAELHAVGDRLAAKRPHFPISQLGASSGRGLTAEELHTVKNFREGFVYNRSVLLALLDRLTEGTTA